VRHQCVPEQDTLL